MSSGAPIELPLLHTGQNVGGVEIHGQDGRGRGRDCWAAKEESKVTFVHLNGGFQGGHALEFIEPLFAPSRKTSACSWACS